MRIALIEPDRKVASFLRRGLQEEGHTVELLDDPALEPEAVAGGGHDLVVLALAPGHGLATLRALRGQDPAVPVLTLVDGDRPDDRVRSLDLGADDCLAKPFPFQEFSARVRALLRRAAASRTPRLQVADLSLDPATRVVMRAGRRISLTGREYALLEYFMRNPGRVLTRPLITEHVWGLDFDPESNVVEVYVGYLRRKIDDGARPLIHTLRGAGYMMRADEGVPAPDDAAPVTRVTAAPPARRIRIAIVDDHSLFREGVRRILEVEPDMVFAGQAGTAEEAFALVARGGLDVLLLDLRLAGTHGIDLLPRLVAGDVRVLVVTAFPEEAVVARALRLGVRGIVLKDAAPDALLAAVRAVARDEVWLPPDVTARLAAELRDGQDRSPGDRVALLTGREREIVALVGRGLRDRDIAERLRVTEKTVAERLAAIAEKVGVADRLELGLLAIKTRLVDAPAR